MKANMMKTMKKRIQNFLTSMLFTVVLTAGLFFAAFGEPPVKNCASESMCNNVTQCFWNNYDTYTFLYGGAACCGQQHYGYRGNICKAIE